MTSPDATIAFYDRHADDLAARYGALSPDAFWSSMADLFMTGPDRIALDVGAGSGSGRDAAWFAARGLEVVAAEPAAGMRREGEARHPPCAGSTTACRTSPPSIASASPSTSCCSAPYGCTCRRRSAHAPSASSRSC